MSEIIKEYANPVFASDVFDYGHEQDLIDFLSARPHKQRPDWVIGNFPYALSLECTLRALQVAKVGVASLCRLYFLQSNERYERLFSTQPPSFIGHFAERIAMYPGEWNPEQDGSLATYAWFVWIKPVDGESRNIFIPPGCRERLTKPEDRRLAERKFVEPLETEAAE